MKRSRFNHWYSIKLALIASVVLLIARNNLVNAQEIILQGHVSLEKIENDKAVPADSAHISIFNKGEVFKEVDVNPSGAFDIHLPVGRVYELKCTQKNYTPKSLVIDLTLLDSNVNLGQEKVFDLVLSLLDKTFLTPELAVHSQPMTIYWDTSRNSLVYSQKGLEDRWAKVDSLRYEYKRAVNEAASIEMSQKIAEFTHSIDWPITPGDTVDVGVYQDYPLFVNLIRERKLNLYFLNSDIHYLSSPFALQNVSESGIDLLYVNTNSGLEGNWLLSNLDKNVLLVTNGYGFHETMINFNNKNGKTVFEINEIETAKRGFRVPQSIAEMASITSPAKEWQMAMSSAQQLITDGNTRITELESEQDLLRVQNSQLLSINESLDSLVIAKNTRIDSFTEGIQLASIELAALNKTIDLRNYQIRTVQQELDSKQDALQNTIQTLKISEQSLKDYDEKLKQRSEEVALVHDELLVTRSSADYLKKLNWLVCSIVFIISSFLVLAFIGYKKQNRLIKEVKQQSERIDIQRAQLEYKNGEMNSSITYAKRIQDAMLPSVSSFKKHFEEAFIMYEPKDIVAGDFFWYRVSGDQVYFAVADCTGHGVPGAMMTVVCYNALDRAYREMGDVEPAILLHLTRKYVIDQVGQGDENVMDGMDIALCSFNRSTQELQFSGAHHPIWIVSEQELASNSVSKLDVKGTPKNFYEIKGNKQPVAKFTASKAFKNHSIRLGTGDTIYIFSDGFADQFGGKRGKKMKQSLFKEIIAIAQDQEQMENQKDFISEYFVNWRGDLEQVDDVCLMGIKL